MNHPSRRAALLLLAGLAWAGCSHDPLRPCDAFSPSEDAGIYCNAHKDLVLEFVRNGRDAAERGSRLEWFKGVLKAVDRLPDSDEIHAELARHEKSRPDFWIVYDKHHFWAGRDTNLGLERRGELMKCGFRHAVHELGASAR